MASRAERGECSALHDGVVGAHRAGALQAQRVEDLGGSLTKLLDHRTPDGRYLVTRKVHWQAVYRVLGGVVRCLAGLCSLCRIYPFGGSTGRISHYARCGDHTPHIADAIRPSLP